MVAFITRRLFEAFYLLAFPFLALVAAFLFLIRRSGFKEACQRLGLGPWPKTRHGVWVHVSSSGELAAARPFLRFWKEWSREPMVLSYFNAEVGARFKAEGLFEDGFVLPLENPFAYRILLNRLKPRRVFFFETEIWPALLARLDRHKVPAFLLNAYVNDKPFATYQRFSFLFKKALGRYRFIGARTDFDARRFTSLGAPAKRVGVCGDLKYDGEAPVLDNAKARKYFLPKFPADSKVIVYGSTHPGEDIDLIEMMARVEKNRKPGAKGSPTVHLVAPRHLDRAAAIISRATELGFAPAPRSKGAPKIPAKGASLIYVLDTLGDLRQCYAMANLVFIGGSLVDHGGHNPLEPLYAGVLPRVGPHMQNFADMMAALSPYVVTVTLPELEKEVAAVVSGKIPKYPKNLGPQLKAKFGGAARKLAEAVEWAD